MKPFFIAFFVLLFISCNDDENCLDKDYRAENEEEIIEFIDFNNLDASESGSGLFYVIDEPGTGAQPTQNSNVTVAYKGTFTNGDIFDQSDEDGISFDLNRVIPGWTEGIQYFKEGGSGLLLIPAHLAYGSCDYNGIPGGSVLVFEVNLISIN
ncbi:FKBP-type peptidyl-prolyl cis-trans isomerase [Lutimonas halocynthiae]|uniref:FKBP-type peptidyl-prolyl cis-trans isomerase n=1 Tax=Lutimonas halocynthiae TaxID=1446477 RepID=UPI0025B458FD|nr:FKBP-type peptidyl-prolyl cis-trans isomerase [Lutimonas halocynthiae]MDN3644016.1 FKBP-type peptidyl-prolyl cis-trans isomerase [Lutimonas halocynthiae]